MKKKVIRKRVTEEQVINLVERVIKENKKAKAKIIKEAKEKPKKRIVTLTEDKFIELIKRVAERAQKKK